MLYLIKLIAGKDITLPLLHATKIGKVFTRITQLDNVNDKEVLKRAKTVLEAWKELNRQSHARATWKSEAVSTAKEAEDTPTKEDEEPTRLDSAFALIEDKPFIVSPEAIAAARMKLEPT